MVPTAQAQASQKASRASETRLAGNAVEAVFMVPGYSFKRLNTGSGMSRMMVMISRQKPGR
jgi:hypothetical protein